MKLIIIAGGKGTRLLNYKIPKSLIKIGGKPIIKHQIELAREYGINEVIVLEGYGGDKIVRQLGDGQKFGVKITHFKESYPLGTAGSLKLLENILHDRFMIFYGDLLANIDLESFMVFDSKTNSLATLIVHPNTHPIDSDLIEINGQGKVVNFFSKPHKPNLYYNNLVNAAIYILSPEIFNYIPEDKYYDFGQDLFPLLLKHKKSIYAYKTAEYIKDMGTVQRLRETRNDWMRGKVKSMNKKNKQRAIFLDRDGVINKYVKNLSHVKNFKLIKGVSSALKKINSSCYLKIVITNQPSIAKGFMTEKELKIIHSKMEYVLGKDGVYLDDIFYCPHHPDKGFVNEIAELKIKCSCRKPDIGMFLAARKNFNIDLEQSWMIGDSERDILAGEKAGCKTILIDQKNHSMYNADYIFPNLAQSVNFILNYDNNQNAI